LTGFLLDTNVVSEAIRPEPDVKVAAWIESAPESLLHLSVLTLGEIRKAIEALPNSARRVQLETWCDRDLIARFQGRILSTDLEVVQHWGRLAGRAVRQGAAMPVIDGLLAATAVYHNLTLVTRDTRHLEGAGISFFNPWEA
jgi:toxin FitB